MTIAIDISSDIIKKTGVFPGSDTDSEVICMADDNIIVKAKIAELVSCVPTHKVMRDPEGEKRVKEDLEEKLKAEGLSLKPEDKDFQSRYRTKLRAYAEYMDGVVVEEDGNPALMVPQKVFIHEVKLAYEVKGKEYEQTVSFAARTKDLKVGMDFFITVSGKNPTVILKKSLKDYRKPEPVPSSEGGFFMFLLILGAIMLWAYLGQGA